MSVPSSPQPESPLPATSNPPLPNGTAPADPGPIRSIPSWVLALVGGGSLLVSAAIGFFLLMMAGFACDSNWTGCSQVGATSVAVYAGVTLVFLIGAFLLGAVSRAATKGGRTRRVVSIVLMPVAPLVGFLLALGTYVVGYRQYNG